MIGAREITGPLGPIGLIVQCKLESEATNSS